MGNGGGTHSHEWCHKEFRLFLLSSHRNVGCNKKYFPIFPFLSTYGHFVFFSDKDIVLVEVADACTPQTSAHVILFTDSRDLTSGKDRMLYRNEKPWQCAD